MFDERRRILKFLSISPFIAAGACTRPDQVQTGDPKKQASTTSETTSSSPTRGDDSGSPTRDQVMRRPGPTEPECPSTGSDILGPFHREGAPKRTMIAGHSEPGRRLMITGRVLKPDCQTPVSGAVLDIWHADANGKYDHDSAHYRLRAQVTTDAVGRYHFETIQPGHYPLGDSMRPAHIHFNVSYPGYRPLTTQLYFKDDPYLKPKDPCEGCNSGDPTLIIELVSDVDADKPTARGVFDIVLRRA